MTVPGWYPDPGGQPGQRYFDGTNWTDQRAPAALQAAPQKRARPGYWVLLSVVGVAVLFFGGCVAFVGMIASDVEDSTGPAATREAAGKIGSEVRDGKFAFIVDSVGAWAATTGGWSGSEDSSTRDQRTAWDAAGVSEPRGKWVIANVRVSNIGDEPQSFFVGNQKLIDAAGREYAADSMLALALNEDSMVLDLGPGFSLNVSIPFDIPTNATPASLILHDSMLSNGAKVDV